MTPDFHRIMEYIKIMQSRYHRALSAFHVYDTLVQLSAPNIVGQTEAEQNVKVFGDFKDFFLISKEAVRVYFFLELAKMFDTSDQALQIKKLVNFAESKIENLKVQDFAEYNGDRQLVEELVKTYDGISHEDLAKIREMLKTQEPIIEKLLTYRDKWLAHDDRNKPEVPLISVQEIEGLFETLSKIMNMFGSRINHETWMWSHVKENSELHTKLVVEHLKRFEPYRIKEIEAELKIELEKYKKMSG